MPKAGTKRMLLRAVATAAAPGAIASMVMGCGNNAVSSGFYGDTAYDGGYESSLFDAAPSPASDASDASDAGDAGDAGDASDAGDAGDAG